METKGYGHYKVTAEQIAELDKTLKEILTCLEHWTYIKK